jgi:hypothetical protein
MNRVKFRLFVMVVALGAGTFTLPARADVPASVAIIDTGVNTSLFTENIVAEYCTVRYGSCPNGQATMEGAVAANVTGTTNTYFDHGTRMASIILQVNPAIKIIPIRIVAATKSGAPYLYNLADVKSALTWVVANREKYNIVAVNISQGKIFPKGFSWNRSMAERHIAGSPFAISEQQKASRSGRCSLPTKSSLQESLIPLVFPFS